MALQITSANFEQEVAASSLPVLLDFWAPWCGPCQMMSPIIDDVAAQYQGKVKVCKLNVDDAADIATKFSVMNIPTLMIFKNGSVMEKRVGAMTKAQLEKVLQPYL